MMSPQLMQEPTDLEVALGSDRRARSSGEYRPFGNMESRNGLQERIEIPLMLHALRLARGGTVLEVGCGRGVALPVLAARLAPDRLLAVDIDASFLDVARRRLEANHIAATLIEGDVRALPLESESVDMVIDFGTCYHVSGGTHGARTALLEIARVLRPGGVFVHETRVAQHLAHPVRSFAKSLPWYAVPSLMAHRSAVLWAARRRRLHWER
jgi:ubiquinone/menaquinone biosynthesis C-methylase UbiE